jgi:sigma-B regulation protein RsbU (phosphoserine phosphatase)
LPVSRTGTWRRRLLLALAVAYAGLNVVYSAVWIQATRRGATAFLGIDSDHDPWSASIRVISVAPGTGAEGSGLRAGDRIVAVNGRGVGSRAPFEAAIVRGTPGDSVTLSVLRDGNPRPLTLVAVVGEHPDRTAQQRLTRWIASEILNAYPLLFLAVAIPLLFLRVEDRDAWLLALLFSGFIAGAPYTEALAPDGLRGVTLAFKLFFWTAAPALCLLFFSVFPERSPLDRRAPWLKTAWLATGLAVAVPLSAVALAAGSAFPVDLFVDTLPRGTRLAVGVVYSAGGVVLGLLSLTLNGMRGSETARRKTRVIVWGTVLGVAPMLVLQVGAGILGRDLFGMSFWLWAPTVMALFLVPLSIAYAVLKHHVLDIPVLLRRGARYLLVQRGAVGLLALLGLGSSLAFADSVAGYLDTPRALPAAALGGVAFGTLLIWTGTRLHHRVRGRIDRAFFRNAYDARQILQALAERARKANSREDLAALIDDQVFTALLPRSLSVYFERGPGVLERSTGTGGEREVIEAAHPALQQIAAHGRPADVGEMAPPPALPPPLTAAQPECLVPILGRDGQLTGLVSLGPRLADEPYSREDKALLASVASQAAITLEALRLAEQMAERRDLERRAEHELHLAQQVQRRLLPQVHPHLRTLEYAGQCIQARAVGGDYYDFLDLGAGRVGLVLADVSGKGFAAALLMAALQASLRSRDPEDLHDLPRQLRAVNHLLYRSSEASRFATLFIGVYDDEPRRLVYANCGHNPPLVLRRTGEVDRLAPTGPVLGLFEEWECASAETTLAPGDLVALYTDGVVEAFSDAGEEFGEARLQRTLRAHGDAPLRTLIDDLVTEVTRFSGHEQEDDLTLLLARGV